MKIRTKLITGTASGILAIALVSPALAQSASIDDRQGVQAAEDPDGDGKDDYGNDIVVIGIRSSLQKAANKKRNAKQIVDAVVAEDVGKLPDNNVPEALARVPGVQIDRIHGEGSGVAIRGLTDIQTTVNGYNNAVGGSRTSNLSDIPAELLKSVEVYKTRTADQVEGGIGGTVNVELRRPLDLPKGLTVAGSFREVFSNIGNTKSPYASLLLADRFDTGIGEFGILVNAAYTKNNYNENFIESESPGLFFGSDQTSLPANRQMNTIAPYAVNYGVEAGSIERRSVNVSTQWRPSDNLEFVLEGSYFGSRETRARDRLHLVIRNGNYNLSNVTYQPDDRTVRTVTVTQPLGFLNGGPESYYQNVDSDNYQTNFETHWHDDNTQINGSVQYNWSKSRGYDLLSIVRLKGVTSATADFNSPNVPGGGPYITFNGVDLSDVSRYSLQNFHDELSNEKNNEFASQIDLTHKTSDTGLLRSFQIGARYSRRNTNRIYGYRDSFPIVNGASPDLTAFPTGAQYTSTTPDIPGFAAPTWYHLSGPALADNIADVRSYLATRATCCGVNYWALEYPALQQVGGGSGYKSRENTFAAYAQINYAIDIGFPIDGVIGARAVNTWGAISSTSASIANPTGVITVRDNSGRGNYLDLLPSANAVLHFTPKLQLRLAYTKNVQRPNFLDLSPFVVINGFDTNNVFAGNPNLKANKENSYDASLEYYFGRAGSITAAAYLKKPNGFIYYSGLSQFVPELGREATVFTNRNAGPGTFQGFEVSAQTFFDFLPDFWRNFGVSANATYLAKGEIKYPDGSDNAAIGLSKYTYNLAFYYDTPVFSARVAYNYRARYRLSVQSDFPEYSLYNDPTSRLDAAINFTPVKFLTLSVEAANLLKNSNRVYWGRDRLLPQGLRVQARTIQASARFRF
ncbi:iron complex outermembrane receptor protein [Sphingomonas sp. UYAg733]